MEVCERWTFMKELNDQTEEKTAAGGVVRMEAVTRVSQIWVEHDEEFLSRLTEKVLSFHERLSNVQRVSRGANKDAVVESSPFCVGGKWVKNHTTFCLKNIILSQLNRDGGAGEAEGALAPYVL